MRFASCEHSGRVFAAAIVDDVAIPLCGIAELGAATPSEVLADPPLQPEAAVPLSEVRLRPVVPKPDKIVCVGLNYRAHVKETGRNVPEYPVLFTKFANSLTGPFDPIPIPPESKQVDFEGELAVIIGSPGRRITPDDALAHVAGYTIANDVSMRDYQYKTPQWLQGKAWERSTPLGPWLVTPDEAGPPSQFQLTLTLNGDVMQHASTAQLMFDIATLVSVVSEFSSLATGDVILTGTPDGVGVRRSPPVLLEPGDHVRVSITGLGSLDNDVVAER